MYVINTVQVLTKLFHNKKTIKNKESISIYLYKRSKGSRNVPSTLNQEVSMYNYTNQNNTRDRIITTKSILLILI